MSKEVRIELRTPASEIAYLAGYLTGLLAPEKIIDSGDDFEIILELPDAAFSDDQILAIIAPCIGAFVLNTEITQV